MRARPSYLRSFSDPGGTVRLPLLHAPAAPLWPLRSAAADPFPESVAPQTTPPRPALPILHLDSTGQPKDTAPVLSETITPTRTSDPIQPPPSAAPAWQQKPEPLHRLEPLHPAVVPPSSTETPHRPRETHTIATPPEPGAKQPVAERAESPADSAPRRETPKPATTPSVQPSPYSAITPQSSNPSSNASSNAKPAPAPPSPSAPFTANSAEPRDRNGPTSSASRTELEPLLLLERASLRSAAAPAAPPRDAEKAESRSTVHIGKIDIHIAPPPAPAVPRRVMRQMPANPGAALASGFLSSFGLRQG